MKDPIRVTTTTKFWRAARRLFTRSEWIVWLLGLTRTSDKATDPGLVMIQIDGLSRQQLQSAIDSGRMPFLKNLLVKESFDNHLFYSGLPSSTPAVQAELYYGQRTAVPAFGFRDHRSGHLVRMFANEISRETEANLARNRIGLLKDGSSYSNNYSGGASEVHFCATSFGWNEFLNTVNPVKIIIVMLLNFWMFIRVFALMSVELILATFDFFRGIVSGRRFWQELIMIPARMVVVVLLRELVTVGACYDTARGLPIIHLNFLGYDEQAHRRGPGSRFAHWTLQGIDRCIKRIWNAAHRGAGREYDFWIFSDHGQETTSPYEVLHGQLIQQVVAQVVDDIAVDTIADNNPMIAPGNSKLTMEHDNQRLPTRADWIGLGWLVTMLFGEQDQDMQTRSPWVQTVTSGPVGFIYLLSNSVRCNRSKIASTLVECFDVPMCIFVDDKDRTKAVTNSGCFDLIRQRDQVFGMDHPFLEEIAPDLDRMVRHVDSGDILMVGWDGKRKTTSFVLQNGAHAGPGTDETGGFALLPSDTLLPVVERSYLRPNDLRLAALRFLGRDERGEELVRRNRVENSKIRVLTYNVHACVGMDGLLSPERIARVIDQSEADIVCLQELDVFRRRSGKRDQAHAIAAYLEMTHQFHPAWHLEEEKFGNAILTRFPMRTIQEKSLHHHKADRSRRSALWVEIDVDSDHSIQIINTHLSIYPQEQKIQAQQLIDEWLQPASLLGPVVLCGDLNARPGSATHQMLCSAIRDVESFDNRPTRRTLFSPLPLSRVDHGFVSSELICEEVQVINTRLAKIASDHLPVIFDLSFQSQQETATGDNGNDSIDRETSTSISQEI